MQAKECSLGRQKKMFVIYMQHISAMPTNVIVFYSDKSHIITLPGKK